MTDPTPDQKWHPHPDYGAGPAGDPKGDLCTCGGIRYWHATEAGGGCEDCPCPDFDPKALPHYWPAGDERDTAVWWCKDRNARIVESVTTAYEGHSGHRKCVRVSDAAQEATDD